MMEHTDQIARCITRPCIDPALFSGSCPQPACNEIPNHRRDLMPRFHQSVQHREFVRMIRFPACGCIAVAPLRVDIVELFPSSSECAFGDVIIVDASYIGALDFHAMVSVRDAQGADVPVPLRCCAQREIPIAWTAQQQHERSIPSTAVGQDRQLVERSKSSLNLRLVDSSPALTKPAWSARAAIFMDATKLALCWRPHR